METKNNPGTYDCIASAHPDEAMFALLGRDRIAGSLVRLWAAAREQMGEDPPKVAEAHDCAALMDWWCRSCGKTPADVLDLLPFEVLQGAVQRRGAIVARPSDFAPGDVSVVASTPLSPTLVLTGKQLRIAEMLAEDDDTEVCVGFGSPDAKAGPGMYAWVQGYPEVGAVPLFDESVPLNEPWVRDNERASNMLSLVGYDAPATVLATWSDEQVRQAEEWAGATHLHASDNDDVIVPPRPAFLPEPWNGPMQGEGVWATNPTPIKSTETGTAAAA